MAGEIVNPAGQAVIQMKVSPCESGSICPLKMTPCFKECKLYYLGNCKFDLYLSSFISDIIDGIIN